MFVYYALFVGTNRDLDTLYSARYLFYYFSVRDLLNKFADFGVAPSGNFDQNKLTVEDAAPIVGE